VIHLAAQAGVRYSIDNPHVYAQSNLLGMTNVLEACRRHQVKHLVYASSSSVYGQNAKCHLQKTTGWMHRSASMPPPRRPMKSWPTAMPTCMPCQAPGCAFSPCTGHGEARHGPWLFTEAILQGRPIKVFNHGQMQRDFTFIDDIVEGVLRVMRHVPESRNGEPPYALFNIGNHNPASLLDFIHSIETACKA
jgi:UDP-glucuronate 4-epimerase